MSSTQSPEDCAELLIILSWIRVPRLRNELINFYNLNFYFCSINKNELSPSCNANAVQLNT